MVSLLVVGVVVNVDVIDIVSVVVSVSGIVIRGMKIVNVH